MSVRANEMAFICWLSGCILLYIVTMGGDRSIRHPLSCELGFFN